MKQGFTFDRNDLVAAAGMLAAFCGAWLLAGLTGVGGVLLGLGLLLIAAAVWAAAHNPGSPAAPAAGPEE